MRKPVGRGRKLHLPQPVPGEKGILLSVQIMFKCSVKECFRYSAATLISPNTKEVVVCGAHSRKLDTEHSVVQGPP